MTTIPSPERTPTMSIVDAGALMGLSPDGAWRSARSGHLGPLIAVNGRSKRVLTRPFLIRLGLLDE